MSLQRSGCHLGCTMRTQEHLRLHCSDYVKPKVLRMLCAMPERPQVIPPQTREEPLKSRLGAVLAEAARSQAVEDGSHRGDAHAWLTLIEAIPPILWLVPIHVQPYPVAKPTPGVRRRESLGASFHRRDRRQTELAVIRCTKMTSLPLAGRLKEPERFPEPIKFLPVIFILGIIGGLYWIYLTCHLLPRLQESKTTTTAAWEFAAFHAVTLMLLVCYFLSVFVHPGTIPDKEELWLCANLASTLACRIVMLRVWLASGTCSYSAKYHDSDRDFSMKVLL
eukprot:s857_g8.t4